MKSLRLGEIIHYNEERAYGFIEVENDTNHYFFHISNLIDNKNTKINIKQKVKFESVYTDKGFTAKDIQFIKQVECPICKTLNYETNKNCTKINCKWDLTYAKDCSYIGLSSEEINKYNIKLQQAKDSYANGKKQEELKASSDLHSTNYQQQNTTSNLNLKIYELKNLSKDEFESRKDFNERIRSYNYIKIGKYKLLNYNADNELYQINIEIEKKDEQILNYEFDKLTNLKITKDKAKQLKAKSVEHGLFAKLEFDGTKYKINNIKFDGCEIQISERELIKAFANGVLIVAGLAVLIGVGIFEAGKFLYNSIFSDKNLKS